MERIPSTGETLGRRPGGRTKHDPVLAARYPMERRKLLEALQHRRGDQHLSDTVVAALDAFLAAHDLLPRRAA